jgi:hypothetical protein
MTVKSTIKADRLLSPFRPSDEEGQRRGLPGRLVCTTLVLIHSSLMGQVTISGCGRWLPRFWSGALPRRRRAAGESRPHGAWPRHV